MNLTDKLTTVDKNQSKKTTDNQPMKSNTNINRYLADISLTAGLQQCIFNYNSYNEIYYTAIATITERVAYQLSLNYYCRLAE